MTALDHVGLSVADLDRQSAWYSEALGLRATVPFEIDALQLRGVFLVDPTGFWAIELLERAGADGGLRATDPQSALLTLGYGHLCLRVDDVDATFARLVAHGAGVRMAPSPAPEPGVRMAFLADPEGNLIELLDRAGPPGSGQPA